MRNRVFFPQEALDVWMADDRVDLSADEFKVRSHDRSYRIVEAVRVLREVTDGNDPNEIIGKVKSKAYFTELGAEILEGSMILGDNAYDIVQGFVGAPLTSLAEHRAKHPHVTETSDEDILATLAI